MSTSSQAGLAHVGDSKFDDSGHLVTRVRLPLHSFSLYVVALSYSTLEQCCPVFLKFCPPRPLSTEVQWPREARAEGVGHTSAVCPQEHLLHHSPLHTEDQCMDECTQGNTHDLGPGGPHNT